ncbi:MAG: 3-oxoacyl-ACP reductase FabG [Nitratireductor sp.]|nr:3-oxoacyl-ACP reductase FabG [Nitratireductor sp.]MCC0021405.1 3-oxoacyl-ACP reductase FabG [Nitratireductor sp.]
MASSMLGRTAVISGGARGIGRAIAERFARNGAKIIILDLDRDAVAETAEEIAEASGSDALGIGCDVANRDSVEAAMEAGNARYGSIDILVNNAGVTRDNLIHKMPDEDWDLVMSVHLKGTFLCTSVAQRYMVANKYGKIVNISSTSSLGNRGQLNYSTAKAGLQGFTRTLALELGRFNINVNCIAPGFIDTEMTRATAERLGFTPEEYKAKRAENIAIRRVGVPEDVANLASFLCDDEASYVNGQIIYLSGGPETRR